MNEGLRRLGRTALWGLALCLAAGTGRAQDPRPSEDALRAIEERGRRLAAYTEAVGKAKEELAKEARDLLMSDRQIAVMKKPGDWHVTFTRRAPGESSFGVVTVAETDFNAAAGIAGPIKRESSPVTVAPGTLPFVKALQIAAGVAAARPEITGPFDESIFREKDQTFSVYIRVIPPPGTARFGGDLRLKVTLDGQMVVGIDPLHGSVTDVPVPARPSSQPTLHSHTTGDLPTDTDVALILAHPTLAPHLVLTPASIFRINVDGGITWLGPNRAPSSPPGPSKGRGGA